MADSSSTPSLWLRRYSSYLSPGSKLTESQAGLVRKSLAVMVDACRLYEDGKHGELMLSYNGGKDATVMLFLSLAARAHYESTLCGDAGSGEGAGGGGDSGSCSSSMRRCRAIYFKKDEDFSVLDEFAQRTAAETGLEMVVYSDRGFMEGLADSIANKGARAFVMGTRRDDPHGKDLDAFSPSSPSWPPFMRVNPILDWKYDDVWAFINAFEIPYCSLYDEGYTSLGAQAKTKPNPALMREDGSYAPAHELEEGDSERLGREGKAATG